MKYADKYRRSHDWLKIQRMRTTDESRNVPSSEERQKKLIRYNLRNNESETANTTGK